MDSITTSSAGQEKELKGIEGWLILVAIGIIFTPFRLLFIYVPLYSSIFTDGTWYLLTTPGTDAYHDLWAPILIGELTINILVFAIWIYIAVLFFSKKSHFPKWYASMLAAGVAVILVDALAIKLVMPEIPIFDYETTKGLLQSIAGAAIWIPYVYKSERVKNTFVR